MDLQSAIRMNGTRWQLARMGVFVCFAFAGGLLVLSLATPPPTELGARTAPGSTAFQSHR
jgi:hypothetical protein